MIIDPVPSYVAGQWLPPGAGARAIHCAITGAVLTHAGTDRLDTEALLTHARTKGGPALRALSFHDRARMLKALASYLNERKDMLYTLSHHTGATMADARVDVDGGIGTMFVFAAKGRREMPDAMVLTDGPVEGLSRDGSFLGQHIYTPLHGVAVHINAYNFPVWGMLEKLAPALLAGVPAIVKPATSSCYVTAACLQMIVASGILPEGAVQLVAGGIGDVLDHLDAQDVVSFTGSAQTARQLRATPALLDNSVRFTAEQDSLNAAVLAPDAAPGSPEFDLFVQEVLHEVTTKAGQKCTAIRRVLVPQSHIEAVFDALRPRLNACRIGDPRLPDTQMGALISARQKADVLHSLSLLQQEASVGVGDPDDFALHGDAAVRGAFLPPILLHCPDPDTARNVHAVEAFGPVATVMGYRDLDHAIALMNRGRGALVASLFTHNTDAARQVVLAAGCWHGRVYINNRDSAKGATGHGAPLPHMVHGGPGRAGGGEELGGIRAVRHYMQRSAVQGSPDMLRAITGVWVPGGTPITPPAHPFTRSYTALQIGETLHTAARTITLADIDQFAQFTGDTFYAHMDEVAAAANPFFPGRVAHGYLLLSFAAGLFVDPDVGPVLANTGLDNLRFLKPVQAGDSLSVRLTVMAKTPRNPSYGEVRWHVHLHNQNADPVAEYELLTMNAL